MLARLPADNISQHLKRLKVLDHSRWYPQGAISYEHYSPWVWHLWNVTRVSRFPKLINLLRWPISKWYLSFFLSASRLIDFMSVMTATSFALNLFANQRLFVGYRLKVWILCKSFRKQDNAVFSLSMFVQFKTGYLCRIGRMWSILNSEQVLSSQILIISIYLTCHPYWCTTVRIKDSEGHVRRGRLCFTQNKVPTECQQRILYKI